MVHRGGSISTAIFIAMVLNFSVFALEAIGAYLADSLALLSDALHNFSDFATLVLAWVATRLTLKKATKTRTYGYIRSEIIVAFINALTLLAIGCWIAWKGVITAFDPVEVEGGLVMIFGGIGLVANVVGSLVLRGHSRQDLNAKSAFLHLVTDAAESAAVVAGGLLMWLGVPLVDPLISIAIGLFTIKGAMGVMSDAINILNEGAPKGISADDIAACLREVEGVLDVHHVHVWSLSSTYHAVSAHVVVPDQMVGKSRELIERMSAHLKKRCNISHPTFQLEVEDCHGMDVGMEKTGEG